MDIFVLTVYFSILSILCVFGFHRLYITYLYRKHAGSHPSPDEHFDELPIVTVQLPVFNEKYVIERLIDASVAIRYPKDKLEIQVLDDSTDETRELAAKKVAFWRKKGFDIHYIHRNDRTGYKAGALEAGLKVAKGRFIAIFDADFIPHPDILQHTIHFFTDPKVGMVQTRWEHLNRDYSMLTEVQAIMLDAHFMIEHGGRCLSDLFFNFNGTAGLWRKSAIEDAGGWQHDTLTEDLDLSYRAQMRGWRFWFVPQVTCPAELPVTVNAFKTQQHRWAKGSIQTMLKILPQVWRTQLPLKVKIEATFHLTGNLAYLLMVFNSVFFVIPSLFIRQEHNWWEILFLDGPLFFFASISFIHFYMSSQNAIFNSIKGRKRYIPVLMAVGIGLGINNTRAVLEALFRKQSGFVRTPKTGIFGSDRGHNKRFRYQFSKTALMGYIEVILGLQYTTAIVFAIWLGLWGGLPFLILFQSGYLYMGLATLSEHWRSRRNLAASSSSSLNLEVPTA